MTLLRIMPAVHAHHTAFNGYLKGAYMHITEEINATGRLSVQVYNQGRLIDAWGSKNLIVGTARAVLAELIAGAGSPIAHIEFGEGDTPASIEDTVLTNGYRRPLGAHHFPSPGHVSFEFGLATDEANGMIIREYGLITTTGLLFSRKSRGGGGIEKTPDISLAGQWTIMF